MLKAFTVFVLVALQLYQGMGESDAECPPCPSGFTKDGNKCYRAYSTKLNWEAAHETCRKQNAHLVVVRDAATNGPLFKAVEPLKATCSENQDKTPGFWTAGKRDCATNNFVWVTSHGTKWPMSYTNWNAGEPNNAKGTENCLHVVASDSKLGWNDTPCTFNYCFVCEVDL